MIDKEQIITIKWHPSNKTKLENLGYKFTKMGDEISVKVKELNYKCSGKVSVTCDRCGTSYFKTHKTYVESHENGNIYDYCFHCSRIVGHETYKKRNLNKWYEELNKAVSDMGYTLISTIDEYVSNDTNVLYECPIHGIQDGTPDNIKNGHGCQKCARELISNKQKNPISKIIKTIESKNNNKLLNPEEYINAHIKNLKIQCGICNKNIFTVSYINYKNGTDRCLSCSRSKSKGEQRIFDFLKKINIDFKTEYFFPDCKINKRPLSFDFYIPRYNLIIEFDGEQHFNSHFYTTRFGEEKGEELLRQNQERDLFKDKYCNERNINILRIPYTKINHEEIIQNNLNIRYSLDS